MPEPLPPYRFDWRVHSVRLVFGNFAVLIVAGIFWAIGMLPFWLLLIPIGIHLFFCFDGWKQQQRKNLDRDNND